MDGNLNAFCIECFQFDGCWAHLSGEEWNWIKNRQCLRYGHLWCNENSVLMILTNFKHFIENIHFAQRIINLLYLNFRRKFQWNSNFFHTFLFSGYLLFSALFAFCWTIFQLLPCRWSVCFDKFECLRF